MAHSRSILEGVANTVVVEADLRRPATVLSDPAASALLDPDRPVAVLAIAAFHFVRDEQDPAGILAGYHTELAPGSALAMTHGSADFPDHPDQERAMRAVEELYAATSNPVVLRARREIHALLADAGFAPDEAGLVEIARWSSPPREVPMGAYGVVSEPLR